MGARAKESILGRPDLSFQPIADLVNGEIEGAKATADSCRWFAIDLRRRKVEVPDRVKPWSPTRRSPRLSWPRPGRRGGSVASGVVPVGHLTPLTRVSTNGQGRFRITGLPGGPV